jgi:hypothetical protein
MSTPAEELLKTADPVLTLLAALNSPPPQPSAQSVRLDEATRRLANHASVYAISHDVPRGFRERVAEFDAAMAENHEELVGRHVATAADRVLESGGGTGL